MKTRVHLSFNIEEQDWSVLCKLLENAQRLDVVRSNPWTPPLFNSFCAIEIYEHDSLLQQVHTALAEMDIKWLERSEHIYTDTELEAFPLLDLFIRRAYRGLAGPKYGTEYDMSEACSGCGTGAIQISPLRLRPSDIPKNRAIIQVLNHEKLVSDTLAEVLHASGVTGLELRTARSHKDHKDLLWAQLISSIVLPPMAPSSSGIKRENPCPKCGRDGYFGDISQPTQIEYSSDEVEVDTLPDVVHTYEHFGNSRLTMPFKDSYFARPLLLIKPKVFKIFREQKVRGLEFVPVKVV